MNTDLFVRLVKIAPNGRKLILHVAKERFPNEALCGRVLDPEPVTPKGRLKCTACQKSLKLLRTNEEKK
jgi:hypothetical protein